MSRRPPPPPAPVSGIIFPLDTHLSPQDDEMEPPEDDFEDIGPPEDDDFDAPPDEDEEDPLPPEEEPDPEFDEEPEDFEPESGAEDDPEPDESEKSEEEVEDPPERVVKGAFKLPVRTASVSQQSKQQKGSGPKHPSNKGALDALSTGLAIKPPPKLFGKKDAGKTPNRQSKAPAPPSDEPEPESEPDFDEEGDFGPPEEDPSDEEGGPPSDEPMSDPGSEPEDPDDDEDVPAPPPMDREIARRVSTVTKQTAREPSIPKSSVGPEAIAKGFMEAQGKFEGDPFETLYIKIDGGKLLVIVESGEEIEFDLTKRSFVMEHEDPACFILEHRKTNIVVFKLSSVEVLTTAMKAMPKEVFMAEVAEAPKTNPIKEIKKKLPPRPPATKKYSLGIDRVKGTSVEDILEQDFDGHTLIDREKLDQLFLETKASLLHVEMTPQRRKELIETHILKPKYSVRRATLLCEWLNTLKLWGNPLTIATIHKEMCTGMLLCKLVKYIMPEVKYLNLSERALTKKAALENLEQALGHLFRSKAFNNARIPTAMDIYSGNTSKTAILLNEIFCNFVQKPLYKHAVKILRWYHLILKQYLRPVPAAVFEEGDLSGVWPHFQSGTALFCVLYHLFGPNIIGEGDNTMRIDPLRVYEHPTSICGFRDNLAYVFSLLQVLNIDVIWTPEDWISNPDTEFIILQLSFIYEALKNRQCSLPPAQGGEAGLTSGPNGEPIVGGIMYKDTVPSRIIQYARKAVLLGHDRDSMPLLPVDRGGKSGRFISSSSCPAGMVSNNAKLQEIALELKVDKVHTEKGQWNSSASTRTEQERFVGSHLVTLLRTHNKRSEASALNQSMRLDGTTAGITLPRSPNKPQNITPFSTTSIATTQEEKAKEIDLAIKNLEYEMQVSQNQLSAMEEALAQKYLDLEGRADTCSVSEYERVLDALEIERKDLEEEKLRLQEHFARKLNSIKEIYIESEKRYSKKLEERGSSESANGATTPHKSTSSAKKNLNTTMTSAASFTSTSTAKRGANFTLEKKNSSNWQKDAEKGWIKTTKMSVHNYHLKTKEQASSAALKSTWTPKTLKMKERERQETAVQSTRGLDSSFRLEHLATDRWGDEVSLPQEVDLSQLSEVKKIDHAFNKFKYRLHVATVKWKDAQQRAKVQELSHTHSAYQPQQRSPTLELIALPSKSTVKKSTAIIAAETSVMLEEELTPELQTLSRALREDELRRMEYEDRRRRMVLSELEIQQSIHVSQQWLSSSKNRSSMSKSPSSAAAQNQQRFDQFTASTAGKELLAAGNSKRYAQSELQANMKWLSVPRTLVMADRTPKVYTFALVNHASHSASSSENKSNSEWSSFVFEWTEQLPMTTQQMLAGSVALEDIKDVAESKQDSTVFNISIKETAKALKNSKGRTVVSIKCNSAGECVKYASCLLSLRSNL